LPTFVHAHPWLVEAVKKAGGQLIRVGSKPWAHFHGSDASERAQGDEAVYEQVHGYQVIGVRPWRDDQEFDYAIRLD
jgi:hypothetical protein